MRTFYVKRFFRFFKRKIRNRKGHKFLFHHKYCLKYDNYFCCKIKYLDLEVQCINCDMHIQHRVPVDKMGALEEYGIFVKREFMLCKQLLKRGTSLPCNYVIMKGIHRS